LVGGRLSKSIEILIWRGAQLKKSMKNFIIGVEGGGEEMDNAKLSLFFYGLGGREAK